ncbi:MAG: prepilin peptidase [Planctomycetaceae bacterium]|jgi:Flp pilus assembly protein protease CpaA|nr:prepilin peptidase [Planctomycetaceae bacterium]
MDTHTILGYFLAALLQIFGLLWGAVFFHLLSGLLPGQCGTMFGFIGFFVCAISTITDINYRTICNTVTYPALYALILWMIITIIYPVNFVTVISLKILLLGFIGCILVTIIPYALGQGGGGDVKLAAVIGLAFGFTGFIGLLIGFVLGSLYCLPIFIKQKFFKPLEKKSTGIPMAGFFSAGLLIAIFLGL